MPSAEDVWGEAEMVLKVKEPQMPEVEMLRAETTLFTYLHLAPAPELTKGLCDTGAICIAYETVEDEHGRLPLLAPMSEIAGKIATQAGAFMLEKPLGGRGILLGGVPGVAAANVMIIGGGAVGMNAAFIAIGMEADVFVYDKSIDRLRELDTTFGGRASTVFSSTLSIEERLPDIDLVIGGVLVHGARAPHVITREQLGLMKKSAVLVDVAIDQGGCFETSKPTTHSDPDLRGGRDHPLLRGEHARRGADHVHVRADQRDAAVHARAGRPRRRGRGQALSRPEARHQRRRRQRDPRSSCRRGRAWIARRSRRYSTSKCPKTARATARAKTRPGQCRAVIDKRKPKRGLTPKISTARTDPHDLGGLTPQTPTGERQHG